MVAYVSYSELTEPAVILNSAAASSSLRGVLFVSLVVVLGLLVAGSAWIVMRQRKRGMMGGDENEDDVEYSRLVQK